MNNVAVLDLDDTLLDLETELKGCLDMESMSPPKRLENRSIILDTIKRHKLIETVKPFPTAIALLDGLKKNNIKIKIITARSWYNNARLITEKNLKENGVYYDDLIICGLNEDKSKYLNGSDRYVLSLEDNPYNHTLFEESLKVINPYCIVGPSFSYEETKNLIKCHSEIKIDNLLHS